jgi:hypothetical protein
MINVRHLSEDQLLNLNEKYLIYIVVSLKSEENQLCIVLRFFQKIK